jgi:hypothetical protein
MQPLDNGPFNTVKAAYRKELKEFNFNNDARLMDKINFIKAYNKARTAGLTEKNIQSAFRTTGNWRINRIKALSHPEIQPDDNPKTPERELASDSEDYLKHTPKNSRQIRDFGKEKSPSTRYIFGKAAKAYTDLEFEVIALKNKVAAAEAENERLTLSRWGSLGAFKVHYRCANMAQKTSTQSRRLCAALTRTR